MITTKLRKYLSARELKRIKEKNKRRESLLKATRQKNVVFYKDKKII